MKKILFIVGLIAVLGLLAYGIAFGVSRYLVSKLDGTGNVETPAGGMLTHRSSELDMSFHYPDKYEVTTQKSGSGAQAWEALVLLPKGYVPPQGGEGPPTITIARYPNTENLSLEEWVKTDSRSNWQLADQDGGLGSTRIDGEEAFAYRHSGLYETSAVAVLRGGYIYHFSAGWLSPEDPIHAEFSALLDSVQFGE